MVFGVRVGLLVMAVLAAGGLQGARAEPDLAEVIAADGAAFIKAGGSDGLSIAMVRDGVASFYNFGRIAHGTAAAPTPDTVYEIGSVAKTVTSLVLAHAVLEKKASVSDDIRRYLPGEYPNLAYGGQAVTLAELVNTTSALPNNLPDFMALFGKMPLQRAAAQANAMQANYTKADLFTDLHKASLAGPPGQEVRHSNVAAELAGVIAESIYHRPYEALRTEMIERPFGMQSGSAAARLKLMATGYGEAGVEMPLMQGALLFSAGGLRYSARDMAQYARAELDERDPAIALTHQVSWGDPDDRATGFNWTISTTLDGTRRLFASGGTFGFASFIDLYPARHTAIVILANRDAPSTQAQLQEMSEDILQRVWGKPACLVSLEAALAHSGYGDLNAVVQQVRRAHPELHLSESYVNQWGYQLLRQGRARDAAGVLRFNTMHHPASWNAYDSLAEVMRAAGDRAGAVANYRRSLALNAENAHARSELAAMAVKD